MTRWDTAYSEFQTAWEQVKQANAKLIIIEDMEAEQLAEIARLNRVIEYVDGVQEAGAKDLMPLNIINDARDTSTNIFNEINHYNSNPNIVHIHSANDQLDYILSLTSPFVTDKTKSAQADGRAFVAYRNVVEKSTKDLEGRSKALVDNIDSWHGDMSEKYTEMNNAYKRFIEGDEGISMKAQIDEFYTQIFAFYNKLLEGVSDEENEENNQPSIKIKIEQTKELILENLKTVTEETVELKDFYRLIFGTETEDGEKEGGLKQEIDDRQKHLNDYKTEQEGIIKNLQEQIEGLLPGATSAGLATAFRELKEKSEEEIQKYTKLFYWSLIILSIIASIAVIPELCYVSPKIFGACGDGDNSTLFQWVRGILAKSLFVVPALWFAIFASKRRSEHQRLQQEYAHKESVSKSFDGYKQQIMALGAKDETLLAELIEASITAIGYNASVTLGGKHGDSPPITEALKAVGLGKNSN